MSRATRHRPAILALLALAACGDGAGPFAGDDAQPFLGGSVRPSGCDYDVSVGFGATAPEPADGFVVGSDPEPRAIHLGLAADPASDMVIGWLGGDPTTTDVEVRFGTAELDQSRPVLTWRYRDHDGAVLRAYEAHLCGLLPDTEYRYQVRGGDLWSPVASFRTAPGPDLDPPPEIVILVLGDARGNPAQLGRLLASADQQYTPDLLLFTGDAATDGSVQSQWDEFLDQAEPLIARIPSLLTIGNHEDGDQIFTTLWALPGDEHRFSVDYGPAHIAVVDDSPSLSPDLSGLGEAFLGQDLPTSDRSKWSLVMHHQPMVSADSIDGHGPATRLRERWMPLIDQYRVNLVLSGHNHRYERSLPMRGGELVDRGTIYLTTAGAGAPLYDAPSEEWTAVAASTYHYVVLRVTASRLEATAIDDAGNQLDQFTLIRRQLGD